MQDCKTLHNGWTSVRGCSSSLTRKQERNRLEPKEGQVRKSQVAGAGGAEWVKPESRGPPPERAPREVKTTFKVT